MCSRLKFCCRVSKVKGKRWEETKMTQTLIWCPSFSHRRGNGWRPSWTSVPNTTKERAPDWSHWAQGRQVSPGYWLMAWGRDRRRMSWEGHRPQPLSACCRSRERAMRRTWRRSVVVQRAPIRRWGHLLLPAQHHCTMETDRSEGNAYFPTKMLSACHCGTSMCKRCARLC